MHTLEEPSPGGEGGTDPAVRWFPTVTVDGVRYARATVRTPWIEPGDDLGALLADRLGPLARPGDIAIVSEKAVVIAAGLGVPVADVVVSPLARRLAGRPRLLLASALAAVTRPLGIRGAFYLVAGREARSVDGLRPPFEHLLLPSLPPGDARRRAQEMASRLGGPVAVVDMNDRGGSVRAVSHPVISARRLRRVLAGNPLGQRDTRTPIGLVRPVSTGTHAPQE